MRRILLILIASCIGVVTNAQSSYFGGYYYNLDGQKVPGLIKFSANSDHITFKENKDAHSAKIKIKDISSMVVNYGGLTGTDSLCVLTEDNNEAKRYFAKFYFATPVTKFYYKIIQGFSGGTTTVTTLSNVPNSGNNGVHSITRLSTSPGSSYSGQLLMYQEGNTTYELAKGNFIEVLSKAFADVPDLAQKIKNKEFKFKQLNDMINWYINKSMYNTFLQ